MNRHDVLIAARLVFELVLALLGSQAVLLSDADIPPAMVCEQVWPAHGSRPGPAAGAPPMPTMNPVDRGLFA